MSGGWWSVERVDGGRLALADPDGKVEAYYEARSEFFANRECRERNDVLAIDCFLEMTKEVEGMAGATVFKACGSCFWSDGSSFYISEGTVVTVTSDDGQTEKMVRLSIGGLLERHSPDWRPTRALALRDAATAIAKHAEAMRLKSVEVAALADSEER